MKRKLLYLLSIALLAACSAPKYTYNFGSYDYNAGKRKAASTEVSAKQSENVPTQELVAPIEMTASADVMSSATEKPSEPSTLTDVQTSLSEKYKNMSASEKKEFRKEVMHASKNYSKAIRKGDHIAAEKAVQAMDHDLKLAVIFGAVGLTLTLFGGVNEVFWILGVISFVVGVVFFVKWVVRQ